MAITASNAYYLKLGRGGAWAADSIEHGRARIGWSDIPLESIRRGKWDTIRSTLQARASTLGAGTMDANALERFCRSTEADLWITFHGSRLWWGRLKDGPVEEDATSKYRPLVDGWHDKATTGELLLSNQIPGALASVQGFRATVCQVREKDALLRLLGGDRSPEHRLLSGARENLVQAVVTAIRKLHPKDFELLVDLTFRQTGWRRTSMVGKSMKSVDMELRDPTTGDQYQVQVKSRVNLTEARDCKGTFDPSSGFRRYYLVVHSPAPALESADLDDDQFELIGPDRLARMVADGGLIGWLLDRIA